MCTANLPSLHPVCQEIVDTVVNKDDKYFVSFCNDVLSGDFFCCFLCLFLPLCLCLPMCPPVCLSLCFSVCLCLPLCLPVFFVSLTVVSMYTVWGWNGDYILWVIVTLICVQAFLFADHCSLSTFCCVASSPGYCGFIAD